MKPASTTVLYSTILYKKGEESFQSLFWYVDHTLFFSMVVVIVGGGHHSTLSPVHYFYCSSRLLWIQYCIIAVPYSTVLSTCALMTHICRIFCMCVIMVTVIYFRDNITYLHTLLQYSSKTHIKEMFH